MERIAMSQEERDWLDWLKRARDGQVTQKWAAEKMGVSDRWVRCLLVAMKEGGDAVVVHGLRGRNSNRRIDEEIRRRAMEIVKSPDWHDFKPTFASEQLAKRHQIQVSKETVRQWMMADGIWQSKGRKVKEEHAWWPRRSHYGELVQWDTSDHDWLEGRGEPVHHLVRMIDDATSRRLRGPSSSHKRGRDGARSTVGSKITRPWVVLHVKASAGVRSENRTWWKFGVKFSPRSDHWSYAGSAAPRWSARRRFAPLRSTGLRPQGWGLAPNHPESLINSVNRLRSSS